MRGSPAAGGGGREVIAIGPPGTRCCGGGAGFATSGFAPDCAGRLTRSALRGAAAALASFAGMGRLVGMPSAGRGSGLPVLGRPGGRELGRATRNAPGAGSTLPGAWFASPLSPSPTGDGAGAASATGLRFTAGAETVGGVTVGGRDERLAGRSGMSTNRRRELASRMMTLPSAPMTQLAPLGTAPSSPSALRAARTAVSQFSPSTVSSRESEVLSSEETTSFQVLAAKTNLCNATNGICAPDLLRPSVIGQAQPRKRA
jgi:hypothetical protein